MNILLVHYKYSISGGPEKYLNNIARSLEERGHKVFLFSLQWDSNHRHKDDAWWPRVRYSNGKFNYNSRVASIRDVYESIVKAANSIYSVAVRESLDSFLEKNPVDVAYVLKFAGKLTPSILVSLKKKGIPVVHRISDYALLCNNGTMHDGNKVCEKCRKSHLFGVLKNCNGSILLSIAYYLVNRSFYLFKYHKMIDVFVIPSRFTLTKYAGVKQYRDSKLVLLPTFTEQSEVGVVTDDIIATRYYSRNIIYWGRVSKEKGLLELLRIMKIYRDEGGELSLHIYGVHDDSYFRSMQEMMDANAMGGYVKTYPFDANARFEELSLNAKAFIFPSLIYDNLPQSVIEALSLSLPIAAADIGSINELVMDRLNGFVFKMDQKKSIISALRNIEKIDMNQYFQLSKKSYEIYGNNFNKKNHCEKLADIFESLYALKNQVSGRGNA